MPELPEAFGRYRLLAELESSPEVEAFRGVLPGLQGFERPVVIRRLARSRLSDVKAIERFYDRARTAADLQHPNAVPVFDVGEGPGGQPFLVEGWVPGPSLTALLRSVNAAGQRLPTWFALHVASEVLSVLVYAAGRGVAHGNLHSDRVRLSYDGEIRVTGFGQVRPADDVGAVRNLLLGPLKLDADTPGVHPPVARWMAGHEQIDLEAAHDRLVAARVALKPRVTLVDMATALTAIEADAQGWAAEIMPLEASTATDAPASVETAPHDPPELFSETATTQLTPEPVRAPPVRAVSKPLPAGPISSVTDRLPATVSSGAGGPAAPVTVSRKPSSSVRVADVARSPDDPPSSTPGVVVVRPAPPRGAGSATGAGPTRPPSSTPRTNASPPLPSSVRRAGQRAAPTSRPSSVRVTPVQAPLAAPAVADETRADGWSTFDEHEPTEPVGASLDRMPTMEIHAGRRREVELWLEVPPTVVGPRRLEEGLRLIRELGTARKGLSLSVDGRRFLPVFRVARQLSDGLGMTGPLDASAPLQGTLTDTTTPLQVIGERARAGSTGKLTFLRHEPDFPERVSFDLVEGRMVDATGSSAPLAAWSRLLADPHLPEGMAARAFAVVVGEDLPISDVGSPTLLAALTRARAHEAEAQLEAVLSWSWARFAFAPGPAIPAGDRVTDTILLPKLAAWVRAHHSASELRDRLMPVFARPLERAEDFDVVVGHLKLTASLWAFVSRLGRGDPPRDALRAATVKDEAQALAVAHTLVELGVLIPA